VSGVGGPRDDERGGIERGHGAEIRGDPADGSLVGEDGHEEEPVLGPAGPLDRDAEGGSDVGLDPHVNRGLRGKVHRQRTVWAPSHREHAAATCEPDRAVSAVLEEAVR